MSFHSLASRAWQKLVPALLTVVAVACTQAAVPTDPNSSHLSPGEELRLARWAAEKSQQEKIRVGQERYGQRQAYQQDIMAGLRSELAKRQELISLPPSNPAGTLNSQPTWDTSWVWVLGVLISLGLGAFIQFGRRTRKPVRFESGL